ncbi:MAG: glycosyltransferase family 4 protein [Elusimicrobiales bacterium]|nr:glycosyltransferase family 4 protein [Elusimicrobiales bacterium]
MAQPITVIHLDDGRTLRGGQRQTLMLAKELGRLGADNLILCRKESPMETAAARAGLRTGRLPYLFEFDPISALLLRAKIGEETGRGARVVLNAHTAHAAGVAWMAAARLPVLRAAHRRLDADPSGPLSARVKYGSAGLVIAISGAVRDILVSHGVPGHRITVINSAIDPEDTPWKEEEYAQYRLSAKRELGVKFGLPADTVWLGSLMYLAPPKDPENLVRSAAEVVRKRPEVHYMLAGEGPLEGKVRRLVKSLGIEDNFHMTGFHPRPYEMLSALDIFVLPSSGEGLGGALLEAMNARAAIASTSAGGVVDAVTDGYNGLLAPPRDPVALAAAQLRLIEDEGLRKKLIEGGLEKSRELSSPRMAALTLAAYERGLAAIPSR